MLLRLIGGEEVLLTERELWLGLRHRDTLFFFAGVVAFLMVLDVRGEGRNYALWQCALFFAASQLLAVVSVSIVLSLLRSLHRTPDPLRLHLTPFAMMAAAFMTLTCELSVYLAGGRVLDSALELAMLWFLFYALGELQAIMLLTMIAPRVLAAVLCLPILVLAADVIGVMGCTADRLDRIAGDEDDDVDKCGEDADGCEPDARGYECEHCGKFKVYGAEECLMMGIGG